MSVWAVCMMKDEQDVAYDVLANMADEGVAGIIVADNQSSDDTRGELERAQRDLPCRVEILDDHEAGYYQSRKMTHLAASAARLGAEWIVPFDADELWFSHEERLSVVLDNLDPDVGVVNALLFNHFATALDLTDGAVFDRLVYRQRDAMALPKVCFRWRNDAAIGQGNHSVSFKGGGVLVGDAGLEVRHFPYRSPEHFIRKARNGAAAYAATDLPEHQGAHWRQYGELLERYGEDALLDVWEQWYWFLSPTDSDLVLDPAPFLRWSRLLSRIEEDATTATEPANG